jgi:hypothetical protein
MEKDTRMAEETVTQAAQDRGLEFNEFLDKVHERIVDRLKEERVFGLLRLGNVWRLNDAEATITQGPSSSGDLLVTISRGPDASRISHCKADSVDSTADAIIDSFEKLTR